tara:strand:- start:266 stop:2200 length:1935 start_codon:yes stop_codon:yes gene_type:complete
MAKKVVVDIDVNSKSAVKGIDKVNDALKETRKGASKASDDVESIGESSSKAGKKGQKGLGLFSKGVKGIGGALKAAGIGILLTIMTAVFEVMRKNQKVLDAIETATNFVAVGFKAVTDALTNAYDIITQSTDGFDAMKKVVNGLIDIALMPLKLLFYELQLAMQAVKLGYEQMFGDEESVLKAKANIDETTKAIKQLALDTIQAGKDVVNNFVEAVGEASDAVNVIGNELGKIDPAKLLETASVMTNLGNAAEIAAVKQAGLVEEFDRLAEKQRQIRDDESASIEDRKKANDELLTILKKQEVEMLKAADAQLASARAQYTVNGNQENYIALLEAENNRKGVLAQITGFLSEQKVNDIALQKEQIELTNSEANAESALSFAKQKFAAEQIENELLRLEKLVEINELEAEIESERLQAIVDNATAGTQAKIDAQIILDEFINTNGEENVELKKKLGLQEVADAKAVAEAKKGIMMANLNNISGGFALLGQIAGKNKALQAAALIGESAASVAKTVIATQAANAITLAQGAALAIPTFGASTATAAALIGANNVSAGISIAAQVAATAKGLSSLGGGGSAPSIPNTPSAPSSPNVPNFNTVGQSGTNQLASAIGGQSQQPIQTYVVSTEMTSAQALERSIVEGASL